MANEQIVYMTEQEAGSKLLDDMLRFLDQKGIHVETLAAWRRARGLKLDAEETLAEMREDDAKAIWSKRDELEAQQEANNLESHEFVNNFYADIDACLLLIEREEGNG